MSDSMVVSLESYSLPPSSQRCLRIDEVFQRILDYMPVDKEGRATVGRLAATCQSLREPALARLWRTLNSLQPLFQLIPTATWEAMPAGQRTGQSEVALADADLAVLTKYAQLVREFIWHRNDDITDDEVHKSFAILPEKSSLFPHVRAIFWVEKRPSIFPYLLSVLGPSTQLLWLESPRDNKKLSARVLREARSHCKNIEHLRLYYLPYHPSVCSAIRRLLRTCSASIRELQYCELLIPKDLRILSTMPRLAEATFSALCATLNSPILGPNAQLPFLSLTYLHFDIDSLDHHSLSFIRSLQAPNLHHIYILVHEQPASPMVRDHLDLFACAPGRDLLRTFCLRFASAGVEGGVEYGFLDRDTYAITGQTLGPLFGLAGLETFSMTAAWLELDRPYLQKCARTWKNIKTVKFLPCRPPYGTPYCPFEALIDFAEHCPKLTTLGLRVDARRLPPDSIKFRSKSSLKTLMVYDAAISAAPEAVAEFLKALYPELEGLSCDFSLGGGFDDNHALYLRDWERVRELVAK